MRRRDGDWYWPNLSLENQHPHPSYIYRRLLRSCHPRWSTFATRLARLDTIRHSLSTCFWPAAVTRNNHCQGFRRGGVTQHRGSFRPRNCGCANGEDSSFQGRDRRLSRRSTVARSYAYPALPEVRRLQERRPNKFPTFGQFQHLSSIHVPSAKKSIFAGVQQQPRRDSLL